MGGGGAGAGDAVRVRQGGGAKRSALSPKMQARRTAMNSSSRRRSRSPEKAKTILRCVRGGGEGGRSEQTGSGALRREEKGGKGAGRQQQGQEKGPSVGPRG